MREHVEVFSVGVEWSGKVQSGMAQVSRIWPPVMLGSKVRCNNSPNFLLLENVRDHV